ncbi:MAG: type II toxin-antitoxin system ParD family antitoxin [Methylococcaceae bacterium]|nr:MAG: type II toxin-antitoxin system ParD family antitoxin [Methylococcaceae bacterium]
MSAVEKISVALTPDLALRVHSAVEDGYYASVGDVIREALRDWQKKQEADEQRARELRALWQEGMASGSAGMLDMAEIKKEARQRYDMEHGKPKV